MRSLTLAYRDDDGTPVIFAIRAMAARHYDLDARIVKIKDGGDYGRRFSTARRKRSPTSTISRPSNTPLQQDEPSRALGSSLGQRFG
jgi:hypothetical protein